MRQACFLAVLSIASFAQASAPQEGAPIRVDVNLVNVTFSVRDATGGFVNGLTLDDFEVLEDGVPQQLKFFGRSSDLPPQAGAGDRRQWKPGQIQSQTPLGCPRRSCVRRWGPGIP